MYGRTAGNVKKQNLLEEINVDGSRLLVHRYFLCNTRAMAQMCDVHMYSISSPVFLSYVYVYR